MNGGYSQGGGGTPPPVPPPPPPPPPPKEALLGTQQLWKIIGKGRHMHMCAIHGNGTYIARMLFCL